ncbi:MAG: hypothetical protein IJU95_00250, partial [Treponema sp.]|nr:hypothetical protein [Treponema sp.]
VVSMESQLVIQMAYIGAACALKSSPPLLFADITSRPSVPRSFPNKTVLFASRYAEVSYLDRLNQLGIVHDYLIPLGSVGLAAVYIALKLRAGEDVPVFVTGLDFSYSVGRTHALNVPHDIQRRTANTRILPVENYESSFSPSAIPLQSKDGRAMVSVKSMLGYAQSFKSFFAGKKGLYDIGRTGVDIGLERVDNSVLLNLARTVEGGGGACFSCASLACEPGSALSQLAGKIALFLEGEKAALIALKDLLMYGEESQKRDGTVSLDAQITSLLVGREYLYLHFPDGYRVSTETAFLKRVRAEIDFFLKQIEIAASLLQG